MTVKNQRLRKYQKWFSDYVAGFYGDDKFVNANIKLKEEHSHQTWREMQYLCQELDLDDNGTGTALIIALFHDIGRFEQFARYRTYADFRSVDHAVLGLDILERAGILSDLDEETRRLIEKAIECHGRRQLPADLDGAGLLFCKLIRDADKLDIFRVVIENYESYLEDPGNFPLEIEFPDEPGCSPEVVDAILDGRTIEYGSLRTLNDVKLLHLGWVYDVNFGPTLKRIRERRFLETIAGFLPQNGQVERIRQQVFAYVDFRIAQQS